MKICKYLIIMVLLYTPQIITAQKYYQTIDSLYCQNYKHNIPLISLSLSADYINELQLNNSPTQYGVELHTNYNIKEIGRKLELKTVFSINLQFLP